MFTKDEELILDYLRNFGYVAAYWSDHLDKPDQLLWDTCTGLVARGILKVESDGPGPSTFVLTEGES